MEATSLFQKKFFSAFFIRPFHERRRFQQNVQGVAHVLSVYVSKDHNDKGTCAILLDTASMRHRHLELAPLALNEVIR